jgi:hypothetical protein
VSFDLSVSSLTLIPNLRQAWEREFATHGFDVEIWPPFDPNIWKGGFLPFRISQAPHDLIGVHLSEAIISGVEVSFYTNTASFSSHLGRTTTEFALQCIGAATLAELCNGQYDDGQNAVFCNGQEAIEAAKAEVRRFLAAALPKHLATAKFPGWDRL